MSILAGIFSADSTADQSATLAGTTSTAEIVLAKQELICINANGDICIKFGNAGMGAATASNFRIPSGIVAQYVLGPADRIRLYNPGATSITYWIQEMVSA